MTHDPLDHPEVREAADKTWRSIQDFERKISWSENDEREIQRQAAGRMLAMLNAAAAGAIERCHADALVEDAASARRAGFTVVGDE